MPAKSPTFLLTLIITLLVLSVSAIGLIVLFNTNRPDSAAIAAACKEEVGAAVKAESAKVAAACNAQNSVIPVKIVKASINHPGFSYPENLQATGGMKLTKDGKSTYSISLYANPPLGECADCDAGPVSAITMSIVPISQAYNTGETFEAYIKRNTPTANEIYRNPVVTTETLNGESITVVRAAYDDDFFGQKNVKQETIYLEKSGKLIEIRWSGYSDPAFEGYIAQSNWDSIKASLDFSKIQ